VRPEERARRDRQAAEARGEQQTVQVVEQRSYATFIPLPVQAHPDGTKVVQFLTPNGTVHLWPLGEEKARELGQQLIAPSVQIAGADEMPPLGNNGSPA
jgi:hypothetical protein